MSYTKSFFPVDFLGAFPGLSSCWGASRHRSQEAGWAEEAKSTQKWALTLCWGRTQQKPQGPTAEPRVAPAPHHLTAFWCLKRRFCFKTSHANREALIFEFLKALRENMRAEEGKNCSRSQARPQIVSLLV